MSVAEGYAGANAVFSSKVGDGIQSRPIYKVFALKDLASILGIKCHNHIKRTRLYLE